MSIRVTLCCLLLALFTLSSSAQTVSIGVFTLFKPTQLEIEPDGSTALALTGGLTQLILNGERGHRRAIVHLARRGMLIGAEPALSITVAARDGGQADFILSVPGKISRHYRGSLTVSADGNQLIPVVSMDIETATASVVAAESPPGATIEALKAQVVVARSFLYVGRRHQDYDFCDTTHCQFLRQPPAPQSAAFKATRDTRGLILTWHGDPLATMYSSRCGGKTMSLRDLGISAVGYPYFAVECAYCRRHPVKWDRTLSSIDAATLAQVSERQRLALGREYGWSAVPSNRYTERISAEGVALTGEGAGHGLGLCQYGAADMAAKGATFAAILRHYYPETELRSILTQQGVQP
jgi:stage II sporulation protein D